MSRPRIYAQTFHPSPVDVAEVFHLVVWFRNISRTDYRGDNRIGAFWYYQDFIPVVSNAVAEASKKIVQHRFCQKRVWEVIRHSHDGETELVPLLSALEQLPQLRHEGHENCTPAFCGLATQNSTNVKQLHKCDYETCGTTHNTFDQRLLVSAINSRTMTTAWTLNGKSLVANHRSFLAVSHVWADGTGNGTWKAGQVNKCLWGFWAKIAQDLECDGVWWDTVCIPRDQATKSKALPMMHNNYKYAKYTVVHDKYLAGTEWKDDGSPCIALVLSPWFTRAWTALELLLSNKVFVVFWEAEHGYILKDLDDEVLAQHRFLDSHAHWIATEAVIRLRRASHTFESARDLLSVLQARYTSWPQDQSIIAGLMCELTQQAALSEQEITKAIIVKLGGISPNCLLHNQPTMSEPQWSWCPPRFGDLAPSGLSTPLKVKPDGTLFGLWQIRYIPYDKGVIRPSRAFGYVENQVRQALYEPEQCIILTDPSFDSQGLLVRVKGHKQADEWSRKTGDIYCQYIGGVDFNHSQIPQYIVKHVFIGYEPEMVDVGVVDWSSETGESWSIDDGGGIRSRNSTEWEDMYQ